MKKRVIIGGLHHESDTFNPIITGRNDIWVLRGDELLAQREANSVSGEIVTLLEAGYEVIPTLIARAVPNGEWDREYYQELKAEMLQKIKEAGAIDAFCLSLHGSMRVKGLGAAEGDLLKAIRDLYPITPIVTSLDMHATVTKKMVEYADAFVGYKTAPHVDEYETGVHAAKITIDILEKGIIPQMSAVHVPFIVAGEQSETSVEPMKSLMSYLKTVEEQPKVLAASILLGFPWADTEENGVTALVVTESDKTLADKLSMQVAKEFWSKHESFGFYNETRTSEDSIEETYKLLQEGVSPIVISDSGDNPTAGSSQDVTNFLKLIIEDKRLCNLKPQLCYQAFYDPEVCSLAFQTGLNNKIKTTLGAKFDTKKSSPLAIEATVKALCPKFEKENDTQVVLLEIEGLDVLVTSKHVGCYDPDMLRAVGIKPEECKVIIVKLGYLEPEIRSISKHSMMALTTGSSDELFTRLPYRKMKRPVYPIDGDFEPTLYYL